METITVELVNPAARKVLEGLADTGLINIKTSRASFMDAVKALQAQDAELTLEEIQAEVDAVRAERPLHKRVA